MNNIRKNTTKAALGLMLAALLMLLCLAPLRAQAAGAINIGRTGSISFVTSGSEAGQYNGMKIPVSVYRVASVSSSGQYTAIEPFTNLNFGSITSHTTASDWMNLASQAKDILDKAGTAAKAAGSTTLIGGTGSISGLATGMYLIVPEAAYNSDYSKRYTFTPYLAALPNNPYASGTYGQGTDEWRYDVEVGLKAEQKPEVGKLVITKTLRNYNETLGQTTFVFEITGKDSAGQVVYSDVRSITYKKPGSQSVTLEGIPAGATVTVTEVYSGASYTAVGKTSDNAYIFSEEAVKQGIGQQASVTFTNEYDGGNRGGYGVTNRFQSDGRNGWLWNNPTAPAQN